MIVIPSNPEFEGEVKDTIMASISGFREVRLYGRKIILTESDTHSDLSQISDKAIFVSSGLYSRDVKASNTSVDVGRTSVGTGKLVIAGGPCAVESEEQMMEIAESVKKSGADMLRGGAFKPRTNPYKFQGLGNEGLRILRNASDEYGLPVVSEIMDQKDYPQFQGNVDLLQVGSRNSQNFSLLKFLATVEEPVLLKNGMATSIDEWMGSAEYLLSGGNENVILCYRGMRGIEGATRFSMDTGVLSVVRNTTHLPLCADPSHPAGNRNYVESMALSAVASGVDMLEVEVHGDPDSALSDSEQQLTFDQFRRLVKNARRIREVIESN